MDKRQMGNIQHVLDHAGVVSIPMVSKGQVAEGLVNILEGRDLRILLPRFTPPNPDEVMCFVNRIATHLKSIRHLSDSPVRGYDRASARSIILQPMVRALNIRILDLPLAECRSTMATPITETDNSTVGRTPKDQPFAHSGNTDRSPLCQLA